MKLCACGKKHSARGMCVSCYEKWRYPFRKVNPLYIAQQKASHSKPDYLERQSIYEKNRYDNDQAYRSENLHLASEWRKNNRKRFNSIASKSQKKHKDKVYQRNKNREASLRGAEGSHTVLEWNQLKLKYKYKCALGISTRCLITLTDKTATRDHVVPISRGGSNNIGNIFPVCHSCNSMKGKK